MTIKKDSITEEFKLKPDGLTLSWRAVLTVLLLSATPPGQNILANFGLKGPGLEQVEEVRQQLAVANNRLGQLTADIEEVRVDVSGVKKQVATLTTSVTGFEVNFEKYKNEHPAKSMP